MALPSGTHIGPYVIAGQLGAGGMGEVYRASDTRLGRDVALKVLPASATADADRLARFEQEARATAALNHPNILALFDIGRSEHGPFLVAELLDGETLRRALERGAIPVRKALDIAVQVARGLAAAHERGIVHRDLKPENVFVAANGHVKILDFGLVKLTETVPSASAIADVATAAPSTSPGVVLGTVGYMAPEQVLARPTDHRADIFSLGAVLYELLTGRRAFARNTAVETMTAIIKEEPAPFAPSDSSVPPALQRVIIRCLEKHPSARFQSADDLAFALETLSPGSGSMSGVGSVSADRRPAATLARWLVAALAGLVVGAAGAWFYARPEPVSPRLLRFDVSPPAPWRIDVESTADVSPDGRRVAGVAVNDKGERAVFVRAFDEPQARIVAGTEGARGTFWSPDGASLAFYDVESRQLKRMEIGGGAATVICDTPDARGAVWTPSGVILFGSGTGLQQVAAAGGTPSTALALADDEVFHTTPLLLPDNEQVLLVAGVGNEMRRGALRRVIAFRIGSAERRVVFDTGDFVQPVAVVGSRLLFLRGTSLFAAPFDAGALRFTGEPVSLVDRIRLRQNSPNGLVSVRGSMLAYVPDSDTNIHRITWFDRGGRQLTQVGEPGNYSSLELSPDQTRAVAAVQDPTRRTHDLWVFDLARNLRTRLTFEPGDERTAIWSPTSDQLVINRQQKATERDLFVKAANGSGVESPLIADGLSKDAMSWSPDGRVLLYRVSSKTGNDIWIKPFDGSATATPFIATDFGENYGRFSPDGRWVAYVSDESGQDEVYVVPFPGPGGKWQLSAGGGSLPRWRGDSREVFYLAPDNTVMAVSVNGTATAFEAGPATRLFHAAVPSPVGYNYAVSRDGQRFLVNVSAEPPTPVAVIDGWQALLRKE